VYAVGIVLIELCRNCFQFFSRLFKKRIWSWMLE